MICSFQSKFGLGKTQKSPLSLPGGSTLLTLFHQYPSVIIDVPSEAEVNSSSKVIRGRVLSLES